MGCASSKQEERVVTVVVVGLDNAGKTTLVRILKQDDPSTVLPTVGFSQHQHQLRKDLELSILDLGGGKTIRKIWPNYYAEAHGAVFVVDASEPDERLAEAKESLHEAMDHRFLRGKPLLVFVTKGAQDKTRGGVERVNKAMDFAKLEALGDVHIEECNSLGKPKKPNPAVEAGFHWLAQAIDNQIERLHERVLFDMDLQMQADERERAAKRARVKQTVAGRGEDRENG